MQSIFSLWEICAYRSLSFNLLRVPLKLGGLCKAGISPLIDGEEGGGSSAQWTVAPVCWRRLMMAFTGAGEQQRCTFWKT